MAESLTTVARALRALQEIAAEPISVPELGARLGVSRTAAYRIVTALTETGFVDRRHDGTCTLGPAARALASSAYEASLHTIQLVVNGISHETGETCFLTVADGPYGRAIAQAIGTRHPLRVEYELGAPLPLERGSSGRALLSIAPAALVEWVVDRAADPEWLRAALEEIRGQRYATSTGEVHDGIVGVSVPVELPLRGPASLSVVTPVARAEPIERFLPALREGAARLSTVAAPSPAHRTDVAATSTS